MRPSEARQLEGCANWGGLAEKSVAIGSSDSGKESSSQRFLEFGTSFSALKRYQGRNQYNRGVSVTQTYRCLHNICIVSQDYW